MRIVTYSLAILSLICLVNSAEKSKEGPEILSKNFFGTIKLKKQAKPINAEKITIARKNMAIPVYAAPTTPPEEKSHILDAHPSEDITELNFDEIEKIIFPQPEITWTYKNNKFIEIHVLLKESGKQLDLLIEPTRKIYFSEPESAGEISRKVTPTAVENITIKGYRTQDELEKASKAKAATTNLPEKKKSETVKENEPLEDIISVEVAAS